jgi:two-component sensor histidine kinase
MSISSLLNIQSDYVKDEEVLQILKESENRANTMALIHKKLYQSDKSHLELGDYLLSLSKELLETYSSANNIKLKINVDEIYLDVDTAIPLGLIVNEVITNSIKYGFPNGESGTITISLDDLGETAVLSIEDDGIGLPKELDIEKTNTLGMQLIISLTKQINAKLTLLSEKGTKYKIEFKK